MSKKNFSKLERFSEAARYIRERKKVSITQLAILFNLSNEYATREFGGLPEVFDDITYDGKYFHFDSSKRQGASS